MRSAFLIALSATFALLVAAQAGATTSVDLIYLDGSSVVDQSSCSGDEGCVQAVPGDTVRFAVTMDVDTAGLAAYGFDIVWDADCHPGVGDPETGVFCDPTGMNTLNFSNFKARSSLVFATPNPTPPPDTLALGNYNILDNFSTQESDATQVGFIDAWDATSVKITGPFIASTSFRLGIVAVEVVLTDGESAVQPIFFRSDGAAMGNSMFQFITPNWGDGTVRVPEPGMTMLILTGLSALGLLALRSRRD